MITILFIGGTYDDAAYGLRTLSEYHQQSVRGIFLDDTNQARKPAKPYKDLTTYEYDFRTQQEGIDAQAREWREIDIVTCTKESAIPTFARLIPILQKQNPNLLLPDADSLVVSTDKHHMREAFRVGAPHTTPLSIFVDPYKPLDNLEKMQNGLQFPVIIKPANQASSLFVTKCSEPSQFEETLTRVSAAIVKANDRAHPERKAKMVVEEYLEGPMYSIDSYVDNNGSVWHCPIVKVITGHDLGEDDFYGFARIAPVEITDVAEMAARAIATDGIQALGLKNTTCHTELKQTPTGWKLIEIGPRIGGFREFIYKQAFGIDHLLNDLLNRQALKPVIPKEPQRHVAVLQFFPQRKGYLQVIEGLDDLDKLSSKISYSVQKQPGQFVNRAAAGGLYPLMVSLTNPDRQKLLADIKQLRRQIRIVTD